MGECLEPVQNVTYIGKMDLPTICKIQHPRGQNLEKLLWLTLKPRSIGATVLVAAQYNRTHWREWSWDIPQRDWEMWNECGKMDPKDKWSPMNIAIWLTDTTALRNTSQKKTWCKTRQQSQQVQQGRFCYLLSCTNTALILLSQLWAFEHFTFVFLVALQNFRLQACTNRISVPSPAGKTNTERYVKRSFHPLTTILLVTHILILCWSHLALKNRETGGSSIHQSGSNDQQCLSAEKSRVLSRKKEHFLSRMVRKAVLPLDKTSSLLCSQGKKKINSKRFNDFHNSHWKSLADLRNPVWACARSVTIWQGTEWTCWISRLDLLNSHLFKHFKKSNMVGSTAILLVTRKNGIIAKPDIFFFVFLKQLVLIPCKWHWQLPKNN